MVTYKVLAGDKTTTLVTVVDYHLGAVGNGIEGWQREVLLVVVAPPNGVLVAAADPCAISRARAQDRLAGNTTQVRDSAADHLRQGRVPAEGAATADRSGVLALEAGKCATRVGKVRVDLVQLVVDLLDGAGDVDHGAIAEGLDVPGEILDTVARKGGLNAKGLCGIAF